MVNIKDIFALIELIIQSPINIFWREYHLGVNATKADCYNKPETCIFNGTNENKNTVISIAMEFDSVSIFLFIFSDILIDEYDNL
jgi:hypothetical protein